MPAARGRGRPPTPPASAGGFAGRIRSLAVPVLAAAALAAGGCGGGKDTPAKDAFHVGLVFDVGGLGDKSFNDSAFRGLQAARKDLGIEFEVFEPSEGSEREAALRLFASGKSDLVFGIGFLFSDDIRKVAEEFPDKKFACIDYTWTEGDVVPDNLAGIKFREEEGSYLVGALAGMLTKTGVVGFVGGMDIPLIHKFEAGYRAGVLAVRPDARVLVHYAGVTGDAFQNPTKGKELALAQIDAGCDILFHAAGSTGLGVFEAARDRGVLAIGVDSDQQDQAPGTVVTSMVKRVDVAVHRVIEQTMNGHFPSGIQSLGLKEQGVDYVYDANNQKWITPEIHARLEELRRQIIDGTIQVPSK
jgi:basic membrane protein A